ncbi:MAG: DsrE/DsrF/DrsH-like family protein [Candidatus Marinimicrobia bacterium]|jgi:sulfide:quinone oxidoreductase|nr:DsrE/DsrF/DrsH-like family protein [Candidatus Neomarinimicrobiota bacterium]
MNKKRIIILGGGTAGNIFSHKLVKSLNMDKWEITVIDRSPIHYYQPGFLFIPFGIYRPEDVIKNKSELLHPNVNQIFSEIDRIIPQENTVHLDNGSALKYEYLIIGTGVDIAPDEVEGMKGDLWGQNVFDFYTYDGAVALQMAMKNFKGGDLDEFIEMLDDAGAEIYACKLAMDMFHLKQDDLDDRVKGVLTVGEFYEKTDDAKVIFT